LKPADEALARLMMASATRLAAGDRVSARWASITDRRSGGPVSSSTVALAIQAGGTQIAWMIVGILVLDLGVQGTHISNQSEVYRLRPEARSG
jgi:hypothetical protein